MISNEEFDDTSFQELIEEQTRLIEERKKTSKTGDNVFHLTYVGEFDDQELKQLELLTSKGGLVFSSYNKSGILYNSLELYQLVTQISLSRALLSDLLKGVVSSVVWDTIKASIVYVWEKTKARKYNKFNSHAVVEREIPFGIMAQLGENRQYNFELGTGLSSEQKILCLENILKFLREQEIQKTGSAFEDYYVSYDSETTELKQTNIAEAIRTHISEARKKHDGARE